MIGGTRRKPDNIAMERTTPPFGCKVEMFGVDFVEFRASLKAGHAAHRGWLANAR